MTTLYEHEGVRLTVNDQALRVSGAPDFDHATALAEAGSRWIERHAGELVLDAGGVTNVSSAMLSVLLEWIRDASRRGLTISEIVLAPGLRSLVEMAELGEIFPV